MSKARNEKLITRERSNVPQPHWILSAFTGMQDTIVHNVDTHVADNVSSDVKKEGRCYPRRSAYGESNANDVKFPIRIVTNGTPAFFSVSSNCSFSRGTVTVFLSSGVYGRAKSDGAKSLMFVLRIYGTSLVWSLKPSCPMNELDERLE